ncbi:6642_t:CDS:2, partial [Gigaspora margarita]
MSAELLIRILKRQIKEGEERFKDEVYYHNVIKFKNILNRFADFANDVSQLSTLKIQQYLDKQKIESDLKNVMEKIDNKFDLSTQEMKMSLEKETSNIQVKQIDLSQITDSSYPKDDDSHGLEHLSVVRKYFNENEVACKHFQDSNTIQKHLVILAKLNESQLQYILRFYGLICINNHEFMIYKWASYGNLKEVYNKYQIPVTKKAQIVFDIYNGLSFLHCVNISIMIFGMLIWELYYEKISYQGLEFTEIMEHVLKGMRKETKLYKLKNIKNSDDIIYKELIKIVKRASIKSSRFLQFIPIKKTISEELGCSMENNIALDFNNIYIEDENKSFELNKIILTEEAKYWQGVHLIE